LLILKLWATGASMASGQSTRGSESGARVESVTEQAALAIPPADGNVTLTHAAPPAPVVVMVACNDDAEPALPREPDDTGPPVQSIPPRRRRPVQLAPPRRARRVPSPALTLRI
jgi:hypothetical protein